MEYQDAAEQEFCKGEQTALDANNFESPSSTPMSNDHTCHFDQSKHKTFTTIVLKKYFHFKKDFTTYFWPDQ